MELVNTVANAGSESVWDSASVRYYRYTCVLAAPWQNRFHIASPPCRAPLGLQYGCLGLDYKSSDMMI